MSNKKERTNESNMAQTAKEMGTRNLGFGYRISPVL